MKIILAIIGLAVGMIQSAGKDYKFDGTSGESQRFTWK